MKIMPEPLTNFTKDLLVKLDLMYPNAKCELNYRNGFELLVSVVLSAQTTDKAVNIVTEKLFAKYPSASLLAKASIDDVERIIHSIGLYHHKAQNIIFLSQKIENDFHGDIPSTRDELMSLNGVGRKTANVVLAEYFNLPSMAVDTHVCRVSKRLGIAFDNDDVLQVEKKLLAIIPEDQMKKAHHQLLFLGRYTCLSRNPQCDKCLFACKRR